MDFNAITILKKVDTDGRVPFHTLDQQVRNELAQQVVNVLKPTLSIRRNDRMDEPDACANQTTVDFTTALILLKSHQWQQIKASLMGTFNSLSSDPQIAVRKLIGEVDPD